MRDHAPQDKGFYREGGAGAGKDTLDKFTAGEALKEKMGCQDSEPHISKKRYGGAVDVDRNEIGHPFGCAGDIENREEYVPLPHGTGGKMLPQRSVPLTEHQQPATNFAPAPPYTYYPGTLDHKLYPCVPAQHHQPSPSPEMPMQQEPMSLRDQIAEMEQQYRDEAEALYTSEELEELLAAQDNDAMDEEEVLEMNVDEREVNWNGM